MQACLSKASKQNNQREKRKLDLNNNPKKQEEEHDHKKVGEKKTEKTSKPPIFRMHIGRKTTGKKKYCHNNVQQHH